MYVCLRNASGPHALKLLACMTWNIVHSMLPFFMKSPQNHSKEVSTSLRYHSMESIIHIIKMSLKGGVHIKLSWHPIFMTECFSRLWPTSSLAARHCAQTCQIPDKNIFLDFRLFRLVPGKEMFRNGSFRYFHSRGNKEMSDIPGHSRKIVQVI